MRIAILALTLALAGCFQGAPSRLVGTWVSENSGAKIKISEDGECRYYFESNKGIGLVCTLEPLSQWEAKMTFSQGGGFAEGEITRTGDEIWFEIPGGGLDFLTLED
jgi:hypothetical protein